MCRVHVFSIDSYMLIFMLRLDITTLYLRGG
jgi:hypothetical protein